MGAPRIILAAILGGYGTIPVADALATALRPSLGLDAPFWAVACAPLVVAAPAVVAWVLTHSFTAHRRG